MKTLAAIFAALIFVGACSFLVAAEELVLASDGKSEYRIVIPDAETADSPAIDESLQQTARLLGVAFEASGIEVTVERERESEHAGGTPGIFLGNTAYARNQGVDVTSFDGWQYVQRAVGKNLILAGHDHASPDTGEVNPRRPKWERVGTAKAVVDFLREHVGTRFLYPPKLLADLETHLSCTSLVSFTCIMRLRFSLTFPPESDCSTPSMRATRRSIPTTVNANEVSRWLATGLS